MLLGFGYWLSKEVILGIDMRNKREPDEALVGASSLSSQALVGRVLLSKRDVIDGPW